VALSLYFIILTIFIACRQAQFRIRDYVFWRFFLFFLQCLIGVLFVNEHLPFYHVLSVGPLINLLLCVSTKSQFWCIFLKSAHTVSCRTDVGNTCTRTVLKL
jgi:heme A synthase